MRPIHEADAAVDGSPGPPPARGTILKLVHRYKIVIIVIVLVVVLTLATGGTFRAKVHGPSNGVTPQSELKLSPPSSAPTSTPA
jgi:hypothetical protein